LSADEAITRDVVLGARADESRPDLVVCVTDATNLRLNLRLVLEARRLGLPLLVALNMSDVARSKGIVIDLKKLESELGVPVVETVAIKREGALGLLREIDQWIAAHPDFRVSASAASLDQLGDAMESQSEVRRILSIAVHQGQIDTRFEDALDRVVLHPVSGMVILLLALFLMFQAVFSWAQWPMDQIKNGMDAFGAMLSHVLPPGILESLLVDGIIAGAGSVLVFLPQILILFFFILVLEDSGYLPRAAFLLDRVMGTVGLSGRSFIPLLSSFACAIPGVMATRTINNLRDRLVTIMIAPLMTCSARLPVYTLIIGAFVPSRQVLGFFNLQGLVLFVLYLAGIVSAMGVAFVLKRLRSKNLHHSLLMELPAYRLPNLRNLVLGLYERAKIFISRVGTTILSMMVLLWVISTYPSPPKGATGPAIEYSMAGMLGHLLQPIFAPLGFNWQISVALVPGMAAREVAVGALGTVYALSDQGEEVADHLAPLLTAQWSLATAFSLLAWYVFAPQCISTLVAVRRETNTWRYPALMAAYLLGLAYIASFITFQVTTWLST
jgi:ferrous iron transport protein B